MRHKECKTKSRLIARTKRWGRAEPAQQITGVARGAISTAKDKRTDDCWKDGTQKDWLWNYWGQAKQCRITHAGQLWCRSSHLNRSADWSLRQSWKERWFLKGWWNLGYIKRRRRPLLVTRCPVDASAANVFEVWARKAAICLYGRCSMRRTACTATTCVYGISPISVSSCIAIIMTGFQTSLHLLAKSEAVKLQLSLAGCTTLHQLGWTLGVRDSSEQNILIIKTTSAIDALPCVRYGLQPKAPHSQSTAICGSEGVVKLRCSIEEWAGYWRREAIGAKNGQSSFRQAIKHSAWPTRQYGATEWLRVFECRSIIPNIPWRESGTFVLALFH